MKNIFYTMTFFVIIFSVGNAAIIYDNGQYNILNSFVIDDVWVLDSTLLQPTSIDIQPNGNIVYDIKIYGASKLLFSGGSCGRDVFAYGSSHVEINSGAIARELKLNGNSVGVISGGSVNGNTSLFENVILTINGGNLGGSGRDLIATGISRIYMYDGTIGRDLYLSNDSYMEMTGGNINSIVSLNNDASMKMSDGNIGSIQVEDTSSFEISGGWVNGIISSRHNSLTTLIGTNFNYPLGYIYDLSGTITGVLANGDPIEFRFVREGNGAILLKDPNISLTIVSPNGGEKYLTGKSVNIEYITQGDSAIESVDIEYSTNNGNSWITIATNVQNTGLYTWITPEYASEEYLIKIYSSDNSTVSDISDDTFVVFDCSANNPADVNNDCYVNMFDLAVLAKEWLWCGDKYNPDCGAN